MIGAVLAVGVAALSPPTVWRDPQTRCLYMLYALPKGIYRAEMLNLCGAGDGGKRMKSTCKQTIFFYPPRKR